MTFTFRLGSLLLAVSLVGAAVLGACERPTPPRFPHLEHLAKIECGGPGQPACLTCGSCHLSDQGEVVDPQASLCSPCHEHPARKLVAARLPGPAPGEAIRFDHARHLANEKIRGQCVGCHGGVVSEDVRAPAIPPMDECLECHQTEFDRAQCNGCHPGSELAQLKPVSFLRHDANWIHQHGVAAASSRLVCGQCHTQSSCDDCHDMSQTLAAANKRPEAIFSQMPHRGDFLSHHATDAGSNPGKCMSCHTQQSCDSCHLARGVSAGRAGAVNPHPPGWVGRNTRSKNFHGRAARRSILACAGCHDQGPNTNCIQCHRPGGPGGSPHPKGWRSSQQQSSPMCGYCHE